MRPHFPLEYALDNKTHVRVTQTDDGLYHFYVTLASGALETFTYRPGQHTTTAWEALLSVDQLAALRQFWHTTNIES